MTKAEGLNRVFLLGNLGADPELRTSAQGNSVLKMRLATTETYLDRNKVKQEKTEWHSLIVFGKRCEGLARVLSKGSRIHIEGKLKTSSFEDKSGQKRYKTEVEVDSLIFCGGDRATSGAPRTAPTAHETSKANGYADEDFGPTAADDDFPF